MNESGSGNAYGVQWWSTGSGAGSYGYGPNGHGQGDGIGYDDYGMNSMYGSRLSCGWESGYGDGDDDGSGQGVEAR